MKNIFLILLFIALGYNCRAQLTVKDITNSVNGLKSEIDKPDSILITALDTLQAKNEVFVSLQKSSYIKLSFQNLTDTVRKESCDIFSRKKDDGSIEFAMDVTTRDITQYNNWLKTVSTDPNYVIDRKFVGSYDIRTYNSLPGSKIKTSFIFSVKKELDIKTQKYYFSFTVKYIRI